MAGTICRSPLFLVGMLALSACTNNPGSTTTITGRAVSDETVAALKASNSDADWVVLVVGQPTEKHRDAQTGHETWRWSYSNVSRDHAINAKTKVHQRDLNAEFDGGRLVRAWTTESHSEGE